MLDEKRRATRPYSESAYRRVEAAEHKAGEHLREIEWELAETVPATPLSLLAVLDYEAELATADGYYDLFGEDCHQAFMHSVRTAVSNFVAAGTLNA